MISSQEGSTKLDSKASKSLRGAVIAATFLTNVLGGNVVKADSKVPTDTSCTVPGEVLVNGKNIAIFEKGAYVTLEARVLPQGNINANINNPTDAAFVGRFNVRNTDGSGSFSQDIFPDFGKYTEWEDFR
ncbi:MAG: hypothetical protein WCK31_05200 [bacterium]